MKPETLLAAARLAYPQYEWHLVNGNILREGGGEFGLAGISYQEDAYALWKALAERGVTIVPHRNRNRITYTWEKLGNKSLSGREFTINKSSVYGFGADIEAMMAAVAALEEMK